MKEMLRRNWVLVLGSAAALVACLVHDAIMLQQFDFWARRDNGGNLVLVQLIDSGLQPNVDFGFTYGPLTVLVDQAWAALAGNNWLSYLALLLVFRLISVGLLVAVAMRLELSQMAQLVFAVGLIRWLPFLYCVAHPGERIGLLLALFFVGYSRFDLALAGCALAAMFRPANGCLVGFLIVGILLWQAFTNTKASWAAPLIEWLKSLAPAAALVAAVSAIYIPLHGVDSYAMTVLPFTGHRTYSQLHPGNYLTPGWSRFFPLGQNWKGYLAHPKHLDLFVLLIMAAGLIAIVVQRIGAPRIQAQRARVGNLFPQLIIIAVIVLSAITLTYGKGVGLGDYLPFFWLGAFTAWQAISPELGAFGTAILAVVGLNLAAYVVISMFGRSYLDRPNAAENVRIADANCLMDRTEYEELQTIRGDVDGGPVVFPSYMGDVTLYRYVGLSILPNSYWCLQPGLSLPAEIERTRNQVRHAKFLLLKNAEDSFIDRMTSFKDLKPKLLYAGQYYSLYRVH